MNLVSLNIRGLGSFPKKSTIKILFEKVHPCVVLLQETMSLVVVDCEFSLRMKPFWKCFSLHSSRMFGDLLFTWDPTLSNLKSFSTVGRIIIKGKLNGIYSIIRVLNFYGPYNHRRNFW